MCVCERYGGGMQSPTNFYELGVHTEATLCPAQVIAMYHHSGRDIGVDHSGECVAEYLSIQLRRGRAVRGLYMRLWPVSHTKTPSG